MSPTLEAESETAADEAAAAIAETENAAALEAAQLAARAEELEAAAASGQFEEAAGVAGEQAAGEASGDAPLTQEQREASAEHDPAEPKQKRRRRSKANEQGNLAGGWEELIGGAMDNELKLALSKPAAVQLENVPEKLLKGSVHRLVLTVKVTGFASDDTLDPETHDVASTSGKRKLRVTAGSFLESNEYIATTDDDDVEAAVAAADEATE